MVLAGVAGVTEKLGWWWVRKGWGADLFGMAWPDGIAMLLLVHKPCSSLVTEAQKWLKRPPAPIQDPRASPEPAPAFPPFLHAARKRPGLQHGQARRDRYEDEIREILLGPDSEEE